MNLKIKKREQAINTRLVIGIVLGLVGYALCYTVYGWFIDKSFFGLSFAKIDFNWGHPIALLVALVYIPFALWLVLYYEKSVDFLIKVDREVKKVTWPTWMQLKNAVWVIIGVIVFFGLVVYVLDSVFVRAIWRGLLGLK